MASTEVRNGTIFVKENVCVQFDPSVNMVFNIQLVNTIKGGSLTCVHFVIPRIIYCGATQRDVFSDKMVL